MHKVIIFGAGNIGCLIACLLSQDSRYTVVLADQDIQSFDTLNLGSAAKDIHLVSVDAKDAKQVKQCLAKHTPDVVVSALPYFCNPLVAKCAKEHKCHYFDLTEDTEVTEAITALANNAEVAFIPQCGLAPGLISIVANDLMIQFDEVDSVSLRVGALPIHPNTVLKYALTWSTDGLINEYGNPCFAIVNYEPFALQPLEGLESIEIDGLLYEAFNTSGGLGSLVHTYESRVRNLTYKTIRYPGHCEQMKLLMNDLRLNEDRATLKKILEKAVPRTCDDVVIVYVLVTGTRGGVFEQQTFVQKIYPKVIVGKQWSAIQVTTACSLCAVLDELLSGKTPLKGLIRQEAFSLSQVMNNPFGQYLQI